MENLTFKSLIGSSLTLVTPDGIDNRTDDEKQFCENLNNGKWALICVFPFDFPNEVILATCFSFNKLLNIKNLFLHTNAQTTSVIYKGILDRPLKRKIIKHILKLRIYERI